MKTVVAMTGASGSIYGVRILEKLPGERILIVSSAAEKIIPEETDFGVEDVRRKADVWYGDDDMFAPTASGSYRFDAMIVAPCTESTVAKIANGIADTLITRTASVCLKEGRRLVLLIRETPKSAVMLENELKLARLGVSIVDANPAFYPKPETVDDVVNIVVGRCLDQVGIEIDYKRWRD